MSARVVPWVVMDQILLGGKGAMSKSLRGMPRCWPNGRAPARLGRGDRAELALKSGRNLMKPGQGERLEGPRGH